MDRPVLSVGVLPRDRNPYQELLYMPLRARGVRVHYLGELTPSRTVNVLALPVELVVRRALGQADVVHLHWVYAFGLPWRRGIAVARLVSQAVFAVFLFAARCTGTPVVWTAHNVLPHDPVLRNDMTGRQWLVRDAPLVIGHGQETFHALERLGLRPRRSAVIDHGPIPPVRPVAPVAPHPGPRRFLFVGHVAEYKGVADLVESWGLVEDDVELVVAGSCDDEDFGRRIARLAASDARVHLDLRWLSDAELAQTLDRADVVVLPFRRVTTTGSLMLVGAAGRPVIIPDLPELRDVPEGAAFRYDRTVAGLARAVAAAAAAPWSRLAEMGAACRAHVEARSWDAIADCTLVELTDVVRRARADGSVTTIRTGTEPRGLAARLSTDELLRGSVNLVANNLFAVALGFVGWVLAARLFPVADVGVAGATIAVASLTANVALIGAPGTLLRFLPGAQDRARLVRTALGVTTAAGSVLALGVVALRPPASEDTTSVLVVAGIFVLFVLAIVTKAVTEAAVIAERASHVALAATVAANASKIVALGALGWLAAGAYGILAAHAVAALLNAAVLTRHLRRVGLLRGGLSIDLYAVRRVGGYAGSQYVNGLAGGLPLLVLPVLVESNLGARMAGFWYIASLIATAMSLISSGVGQSLLVESSHDTSQADQLARRALRGLMVLSVPSVTAALVLAPWILTVFGPGYASEALATFRILALSTLLSPVIYVLGTMFFVRRRILPLLVVNLANAVVVLGLASRAASLSGVAWAWLLGEVVYVALFVVLLPLFPARTTDPGI